MQGSAARQTTYPSRAGFLIKLIRGCQDNEIRHQQQVFLALTGLTGVCPRAKADKPFKRAMGTSIVAEFHGSALIPRFIGRCWTGPSAKLVKKVLTGSPGAPVACKCQGLFSATLRSPAGVIRSDESTHRASDGICDK